MHFTDTVKEYDALSKREFTDFTKIQSRFYDPIQMINQYPSFNS